MLSYLAIAEIGVCWSCVKIKRLNDKKNKRLAHLKLTNSFSVFAPKKNYFTEFPEESQSSTEKLNFKIPTPLLSVALKEGWR